MSNVALVALALSSIFTISTIPSFGDATLVCGAIHNVPDVSCVDYSFTYTAYGTGGEYDWGGALPNTTTSPLFLSSPDAIDCSASDHAIVNASGNGFAVVVAFTNLNATTCVVNFNRTLAVSANASFISLDALLNTTNATKTLHVFPQRTFGVKSLTYDKTTYTLMLNSTCSSTRYPPSVNVTDCLNATITAVATNDPGVYRFQSNCSVVQNTTNPVFQIVGPGDGGASVISGPPFQTAAPQPLSACKFGLGICNDRDMILVTVLPGVTVILAATLVALWRTGKLRGTVPDKKPNRNSNLEPVGRGEKVSTYHISDATGLRHRV